jgi:hypothetical protein
MVTITYVPLGPQYGAMQSLHYVRDDTVWLNMIVALLGEYTLEVSNSRFWMGNIVKLTNNMSGTDLENYED